MPGILVMAAGGSERFIQAGGTCNKLNAPWGRHTVFSATLANALASGLPVHVVTRPDNFAVQHCCLTKQLPCTLLESAGLGDSIAAGVAATRDWSGWLIHLANMPQVSSEMFRQVAEQLASSPIVRPFYLNTPGHPVGFSPALRDELLALSGAQGAHALLPRYDICQLVVNTVTVIQDIDFPSQLPAGD